ncbi:MAG: alpha/beta hydrolase [Alphaproteobacteria bacterium]
MRGLMWVAGVAAFYLAVVAGLYLSQRQLLYHPDRTRPVLGALAELGVREVALPTADGLALLAWYLPPRGKRPVVVYFHGNAGHIGYRADRVERFAREGYGALMLEYRGYGGNPGEPSEAGLFADAATALRFVEAQGVPERRIVLYGESLGTGVAVQAATTREVGAVVLESPYTSIAAAAQFHYPFIPAAWLVADRYDSLSRIGQVRAPILMLHGGRDGVIPLSLGEALFAAAPEPKENWIAPQAGHADLGWFGALDIAVAFIERHVRQTEPAPRG